MRKIKIFVSQPMRGIPEEEIRTIRQIYMRRILPDIAKDFLCSIDDFEVIDSILEQNGTPIELLARSLVMMQDADIAVFLPGWRRSRGCKIEYEVATRYQYELRLHKIYTDIV